MKLSLGVILNTILLLLPRVSGVSMVAGGCSVAGSRIFALGGYFDVSEKQVNRRVYFLELDSHLEIGAMGDAPWVVASVDMKNPLGGLPSLTTKDDQEIFVFGGSLQAGHRPLQVLNTTSATIRPIGDLPAGVKGEVMGASLVQNDLIPTEYIAYGGRVLDSKGERFLSLARAFDSVRNRWIDDNDAGPMNAGHVAAVFQGVMYVIGGISTTQNQVVAYNIRSSEWYKVTTKGSPPPSMAGFSSTQHLSQLFIAGASKNSLHVLDLESMTWAQHAVPGFDGALDGCLAYRRGFLLHAFGVVDQQANNKTQLIDTRSWSLVTSADLRSTNPVIPGPIIIGLFVGCVSFLLLIALLVSLIVYYKRRSVRPNRDSLGIAPPKILTEPIWIDSPTPNSETEMTLINPYCSYYDDINLRYQTMIMLRNQSQSQIQSQTQTQTSENEPI